MKRPEERSFAVVENGIVINIIVGVEDEVVAANPSRYIEYTPDAPAFIGDPFEGTFVKIEERKSQSATSTGEIV
jgi:hypothetical protein